MIYYMSQTIAYVRPLLDRCIWLLTEWYYYFPVIDIHALPSSNVPPKLVILHMNMAFLVYEDIMRMTENLSEKYIIGYGASSTVYKCVLKNCKPVAIKKLYAHYPQSLKEFETELETVGSIKHRNLVSLQGYSLSPAGNLLFYDYLENGSLWDVLHGKWILHGKQIHRNCKQNSWYLERLFFWFV